jgi:MFS family permease
MHVSLISFLSFIGRLLSGIGSDHIVKHHQSRFWCLVVSSSVFTLAQIAALCISDPHYLWIVSSLSGLGYGALFGVYPALVADTFGVSGLSVNWGFMTLAPVVWGAIFNLAYGGIFDKHTIILENGDRVCEDGIECYKDAYWITFFASLVSIGVSFWCIWHEAYLKRHRAVGQIGDHRA